MLGKCRSGLLKVLIINLSPLDIKWKFPDVFNNRHLLPELLHRALGVVQGDVQGVGQGLVERELGLGIPAFLIGP